VEVIELPRPCDPAGIWQIYQVVKRISGTFGWLCHDTATSSSSPLSILPHPHLQLPVIVYISHMPHTQRVPQPIKVLKPLPFPFSLFP